MKIVGLKTHYLAPDGKISLSAVDWWRIVNPYGYTAKKNSWDYKFYNKVVKNGQDSDEAWTDLGKDASVLVSSYIDTPKAYAYMRAVSEHYKIPIIMDIDDNIFEVDEMNPAYIRFNPQSEPLKIATKILQDVDVVTTSTPHLANTIKSYRTKPTLVMPNLINPDTYRYKASLVPQNREKIVIGYQGSSTHYSDLMLTGVMHALRQIAIKYPQVHFHFTGCIIDELEDYIPKDRLTMQGGARDHRKWVDLWKELPYDIGIAPLTNTSFNMSKSPIKYYEYGLRKIPAVYSFVEPYVRTVKENKTGFLAIDEQEWFEKLSWLVENEILRKRMGDRARKDVLENYTIQKGYKKWEELIKAL